MSGTLQTIPPSYLYSDFANDDDLQAFVAAYNTYTQKYLNTFNQINLPIYTATNISGALLDWVGNGIYGYPRPSLLGNKTTFIGPLNTYAYNAYNVNASSVSVPLNTEIEIPAASPNTTDDIYKRCLTWHFYKGDGNVCTIQWLKRRIMRFLVGTNGVSYNVDNTIPISLTFGPGEINIVITVTVSGLFTRSTALLLQAGIQSGALETPFQYFFNVPVVGP